MTDNQIKACDALIKIAKEMDDMDEYHIETVRVDGCDKPESDCEHCRADTYWDELLVILPRLDSEETEGLQALYTALCRLDYRYQVSMDIVDLCAGKN